MQIFEITEGILAGVPQPRPAGRNTAVGSRAQGGSPEYQAAMAQIKANAAAQQQLSRQQAASAISPTASLPKAGLVKNAAEYFANKMLSKAGVPVSQQGDYDPSGHIAQQQGKGVYNIRRQEFEIAKSLAREWLTNQTLNGKQMPGPVPDHRELTAAADLANKVSNREQNIDINKVANLVYKSLIAAQQAKNTTQPSTSAATPATATPATATTATTKKRTGGRVAGKPLSQTANAIRKRAARQAAKTPATKPTWQGRSKNLTPQQQAYIAAINKKLSPSLAEQNLVDLENMLSQALTTQGRIK